MALFSVAKYANAQINQADLLESGVEQVIEDESPQKVDTYIAAKSIDMKPPVYPRSMAEQSRGGWVDFNFMIDTAGKPYEIEMSDYSYGGKAFVKPAQKLWKNINIHLHALALSQSIVAVDSG